jgi:hypothetical protein
MGRTCASLPALCKYEVGTCRCLHTRSKDRLLCPPSPSSAANRSDVSITKMPLSGVPSGSKKLRLGMSTLTAEDLRYLPKALAIKLVDLDHPLT